MSTFFKHSSVLRILIVAGLTLFATSHMFGVGFTPTEGGLVVDLQPGERIMLSTMVNGTEYFVCHQPSYTGGYFSQTNYDDNAKGNILKLIPQDPGSTEPGAVSIWTIDEPASRPAGKELGGIAYTMWSSNPGGDPYTLLTAPGTNFKTQGHLTRDRNNANLCDVVFVVPTNRGDKVTSFDPNNTMGRGTKFDGEKGYGFLGLPYREVYWLDIPRGNLPRVYTNASLVSFNTTQSNYDYAIDGNKKETAKPGQAMYAYADNKHNPTKRTIFRLYVLDEPVTSSCPDSYFFGYDKQDVKRYRMNENSPQRSSDSTAAKKIYYVDRLVCMERLGATKYYLSDWMTVPEDDSTYFYVGHQNKYCHTERGDGFNSQFKNISTLQIQHMGLPAPRGAYGQMIVDTTNTAVQNLGVTFAPGGYFLRTSTGRNIRLKPNAERTVWTCEEMWHITAAYADLTIKATMFTGSEFSDEDPGADIPGWSVMVRGTDVPVVGGGSIIDRDGWARIHIDSSDPNGAIEFVPANTDRHIHYDYNGCVGEQLPDQYPLYGETSVTIESPRLVGGFEFTKWNTAADGSGTSYDPGDVLNLLAGTTTLYAIATYTGTYHVALSFTKADGKRYFMTHPGEATPRFSRARHIDDWTNAWQGMANADNVDNHYLNTFKMIGKPTCVECEPDEYVLDPRREMRYGAIDSVMFYENFAPGDEEYIGLFYDDPNTILANDKWAGLFTSTAGWPNYSVADVQNTKLRSTHYLHRVAGEITRDERTNSDAPFVKYNATDDQFDGEASEGNATVFQISRVRVADEHYVVIPDTTDEWTDEIVFGIHQNEQIEREVWSKLIGKQLMAMMKLGDDTVYFHPNSSNELTLASQLRLSAKYRLEETFTFIRDARAELQVDELNKVHMTNLSNDFGKLITSGRTSPMDVIYQGNYIDIVDTLRINLSTRGPVKIKEYYGRWKDGSPGLHVRADGSRYRDILIRTKTTHYGENITRLVITPEYPMYNFYPLADASKQLNFTLAKVTVHELLDTEGHVLGEEVVTTEDLTSSLHMPPSHCSFSSGGTYFTVDSEHTLNDHATLVTKADNSSGINYDTLIINFTMTVDAVEYPVAARVPLMQSALSSTELIWSAVAGGQRYFIMAGSSGLIFRQYQLKSGVLYKKEDGKTQLVRGSADAANSDTKYITPWRYTYVNQAQQQLSLRTEYVVNKDFIINGSSEPDVAGSGAATLTYEYVHEYVNDNANFEEQVTLKYGADKWLKFEVVASTPRLVLTENEEEATVFSWSYLQQEYNLLNNGSYPDQAQLVFGYNSASTATVKTRYKAYRIYSMLLDNTLTYCGRVDENDISDLIAAGQEWKTSYAITLVGDNRFSAGASGLSKTTNSSTLVTTVTPAGDSPTNIRYPAGTGPFVDIVDTLDVVISLQDGAPTYRFKDKWSKFTSVDDAHLKIPLIRKTYHAVPYDSLFCTVEGDEYNHVFPAEVGGGMEHTFTLHTSRHAGTNILDVDNQVVSYSGSSSDRTAEMDFTDPDMAEVRLRDDRNNTPDWCEISALGANTITVRCKEDGIRSPRSVNLYIAYRMDVGGGQWKYVNFRLGVVQLSRFQYANNQTLIHSTGASDDPLVDGVQQVHSNKNIIYYYNPSNAAQSDDQRVELPVRERNFYGWWRWYSLQPGEEDTDIPAAKWETAPSNTGTKGNYPFRIIGDSVWIDDADHSKGKKLVTQGRYTVFYNPSKDYNARKDPPSKAPMVYPPQNKAIVTYALDKSVYYDNLPLLMSGKIDTARLDTMQQIPEPTLSLREIYELHPWTEMAERMEGYKDTIASSYRNQRYLEDHVVRAPIGNPLLLNTEQRYNYDNIKNSKHSESLMGYYMRDDNWSTWSGDDAKQDTMIWCGGWDADCKWYNYNPGTGDYTECPNTVKVTESNDFLSIPKKVSLSAGAEFDTVIYCLRARSKKSTFSGSISTTVAGDYWFNICRYTIIYHSPNKYGPKQENASGEAIITNDEIEQHYEVLERLNFDYNKPGSDYQVYPHPLPWEDASYGFAYPKTATLPDNRPHNKDGLEDLANMGEYGIINKIPSFGKYWYKMEQHGGAENGYMIFCDGMSSAGQVAALTLSAQLCEGQKMYFSGYVANPGNQTGNKSCPNFTFSVQGSLNGTDWEDITSYMTGDIPQSDKWSQIYFPIDQKSEYEHFRVRVYNMASNDDGNDFIIDDMCIFATKPPLIAYQANTTCMEDGETENVTHVVLRVDYQGFHDKAYNGHNVYYTVEKFAEGEDSEFVTLEDGYIGQATKDHIAPATNDTIYGVVNMPDVDYEPSEGEIFTSVSDLVSRFEASLDGGEPYRKGYVYENIDEVLRPVLYIIHKAEMIPHNHYRVRMSLEFKELMSSICAMTSNLKISNRMMLELNGEEQPDKEVVGMCANTTYDVSLRVRGALLADHSAPVDINGSCINDWLHYGDTTEAASVLRYGYKYHDIVKVIKDILRCEPKLASHNTNQFARNLSEVSRNEMEYVKNSEGITLETSHHPYDVLAHLVNGGFLTMYRSHLTLTTSSGNTIQYVIFPIVGTGSDAMLEMEVDVCPTPVFVKLEPTEGGDIPMALGGFNRNASPAEEPPVILMNRSTNIVIPIDSIMLNVALDTVVFLSTNDPDYLEGVHLLHLVPDREYDFSSGGDNSGYYKSGDNLILRPAPDNNYSMRSGYNYTFGIIMQTRTGSPTLPGSDCRVGTVPFTISVVPSSVRWDPKSDENSSWNNSDNWIGVDQSNEPIHADAHFVPKASTNVIIPTMSDGLPYPVMPDPSSIASADSVKKYGFEYNICDAIRFMPGAAMSQQQHLTYNTAVVDMRTPQNKWALRSAPVTGLLSGDIFMANADLTRETPTWEVGEFDANGRNATTGNASFWLSLYSRSIVQKGNGDDVKDSTRTAGAEWNRVTNGMSYSLPPASGWAIYSRTASGNDAVVRLPKNDNIYYYYNVDGEKMYDFYEPNLRAMRNEEAGGTAGKLAFDTDGAYKEYTLTNEVASTAYVFGNPTMGYIDIWGFIADNGLSEGFDYINSSGLYMSTTKLEAEATSDVITNPERYLPPMHAIVISTTSGTSKTVRINTNRIVTSPDQVVRPLAPAPRRSGAAGLSKGIMTVTAVNPVSSRCTSRLLIGQGYHSAVLDGEDAILTTVNINNYTNTSAPATPFNIYATEGDYGLSINLRDEVLNIPISFYMSDLPYDPVTHLWFTGVNNIEGQLVLYDAQTDSERAILDGIRLDIPTPEASHETRYYIRRRGFDPSNPDNPATTIEPFGNDGVQAIKIIKDGHVLILRDGHVYTLFGQKLR